VQPGSEPGPAAKGAVCHSAKGSAAGVEAEARTLMWNIILMIFGALLVLEALISQLSHEQFFYVWGGRGPSWYAVLMGAFSFLLGLVGFLRVK
jgi:hypothetical protein